MQFSELGLSQPILSAVSAEGYTVATPIQEQAIPIVLGGHDLLGCAQTGTGKTAAFALPILQRLSQLPPAAGKPPIRALILCPTRELATQISQSFHSYGRNLKLRNTVIFGGVNQSRQVSALVNGVDIVIATPGRLLDLMNQGHVNLSHLQVLVLDEADRMLDMGFIHDIRKVIARIPAKRQTLFFSATMPPEIRTLSGSILKNPQSIQIAPVSSTADNIEESVYFVHRLDKPALLAHLARELPMHRAIVFTRTKHGADRLVKQLRMRGVDGEAIHGNKSQNARVRALANFSTGKTQLLIATDIASRGIDVEGISHVVNFDLTHEPETYVHRIGRTARAGAEGCAVSFCDDEERDNLRAIEKLIRRKLPVKTDHPDYEQMAKSAKVKFEMMPERSERPEPRHKQPERRHTPVALERTPTSKDNNKRTHGGPSGIHPARSSAQAQRYPTAKPAHQGGRPHPQGTHPQHPAARPHHPNAAKPHHPARPHAKAANKGGHPARPSHPLHSSGRPQRPGKPARHQRRFA